MSKLNKVKVCFGGWGWGGGGVVYYFLLGSGSPCLEHPSLLQPMLWFRLAVQLFYKSLFLLSTAVSRLPKPHERHWKLYAHFSFLLIDCKRLHRYLVRERERGTKSFSSRCFHCTVQRFEPMLSDYRWTHRIYHYHNYHCLSSWIVVYAVAATVSGAVWSHRKQICCTFLVYGAPGNCLITQQTDLLYVPGVRGTR